MSDEVTPLGPRIRYTEEEISAGWERIMKRAEAWECARCQRTGTRKASKVPEDRTWPVCENEEDCRKHSRHLKVVDPDSRD